MSMPAEHWEQLKDLPANFGDPDQERVAAQIRGEIGIVSR
jgi:hypothetical protein